MSPQVVLEQPTEAIVDDVTLKQGDTDNPTELSHDQIERLKEAGAKLAVLERGQDPLDTLQGRDLDERVKASGVNLEGNATADDKRKALKDLRDNPPSPGDGNEGSKGGDA